MDSIRSILRAAAIAAFTVGLLLMVLNPPSLSGAGGLITLIVGTAAFILLAAWGTVALMGRQSMSEPEFERLVEAIAAHDPVAARRAMLDHLNDVEQSLLGSKGASER